MTGDLVLAVGGLGISIATDDGVARVLDHADLRIPLAADPSWQGRTGCASRSAS